MALLSPSILSADFSNLEEELKKLEQAEISWVHLDVMDGAFVPNISFGASVIKSLRVKTKLFFDVHLMVEKPERYLQEFVFAGADSLCIHAEATVHLERTLSEIKNLGVKVGVALNPSTTLQKLEYILPQIDMVLLMTVNPGFGGQKFIPFCERKIAELAAMVKAKGLETKIQVDGGVTLENAKKIVKLGADILVSGSAFFNAKSYKVRHQEFLAQMNNNKLY